MHPDSQGSPVDSVESCAKIRRQTGGQFCEMGEGSVLIVLFAISCGRWTAFPTNQSGRRDSLIRLEPTGEIGAALKGAEETVKRRIQAAPGSLREIYRQAT